MRIDGRKPDELRQIRIRRAVSPYAEGSAEVEFGKTKLLITASLEKEVPPWMKPEQGGWITAEYGMLPRSTHTRNKREASQGKQSGRTLEIQRLIGRALRAAIDLKALPGLTLRLDCDVLCADGGTRTAAVSGAWVAVYDAIAWGKREKLIAENVVVKQVAAISVGVVKGVTLLDLCYEEDSQADFDLNVVLDQQHRLVEVQGTAERSTLDAETFSRVLSLGISGVKTVMSHQLRAVDLA